MYMFVVLYYTAREKDALIARRWDSVIEKGRSNPNLPLKSTGWSTYSFVEPFRAK